MNATAREQTEQQISHLIHRIEVLEEMANRFGGAARKRILGEVEFLDKKCAELAKALGR